MSDRPGRGLGSRGSVLFDEFIRARGLSLQQVADALHCSDVSVLDWRRGRKVPESVNRQRIEVFTRPVHLLEGEPVEGVGIQAAWWDESVEGVGGSSEDGPVVRPYDLVVVQAAGGR